MADGRLGPTRRYRMGARAEAAQANGERILSHAHDLFRERPYDQVSLEALAAAAGVTVRTVIRRFGSKEHLFVIIAGERAREIRSQRDHAVPGDVRGAVRTLVEGYETRGDEVLHLLAQEPRGETIAEGVQSGRSYHQAWVAMVFSPLLVQLPAAQQGRRLAQLTAVTDIYMWKVLRRDLGLSRREVEASLRELIDKILELRPVTPPAPDD